MRREHGLSEEAILPTMADWWLVPRVAADTAMKAQELGLARVTTSRDEYLESAVHRIQDARRLLLVCWHHSRSSPMFLPNCGGISTEPHRPLP
jgi:malic enzyme